MKPGFRLVDRYRMERRVGRRGAAQVWLARDELLARRVAVTLVAVRRTRRDLRRRLRDAARAAAALAHPNIVTTYDYGEAERTGGDALTYAVTEHLSGESLAARLARGVRPPSSTDTEDEAEHEAEDGDDGPPTEPIEHARVRPRRGRPGTAADRAADERGRVRGADAWADPGHLPGRDFPPRLRARLLTAETPQDPGPGRTPARI